jgi:Flp pilus assembly protein TadD
LNTAHFMRRAAPAALAVVLAAMTAGCGTLTPPVTGSVGPAAASAGDPRRAAEAWGERYRANPNDPVAAINYAQALRGMGQRSQAAAVLEQATIQNPSHMELLGAYGRALADVGNHEQALQVLSRAHTPDQPDWRILNVQGAVLDQMGQHQEAQRYYATALRIMPEEPSVLSNLGLSYALSKNLPRAEATLRRAAAGARVDPRVRQNLALVVGLQGRFPEAEAIARADLPPDEASANVAYLRQMLAQPNALQAQTRRPPVRPQG